MSLGMGSNYYNFLCDVELFYVLEGNAVFWTLFLAFAIKYKYLGHTNKLDMIIFVTVGFALAVVPEILMLTYKFFQK